MPIANNSNLRTCRICKKDLPLDRFYMDMRATGERQYRTKCKTCTQAEDKAKISETYQGYLGRLHGSSKHARKKQGYVWEITIEDVIALWEEQEGRCSVTGLVMTHHRDGSGHKDFNASIDRLNIKVGYTRDNIRLVCYAVNIMRGSLDLSEFYFWIKTAYLHSCD